MNMPRALSYLLTLAGGVAIGWSFSERNSIVQPASFGPIPNLSSGLPRKPTSGANTTAVTGATASGPSKEARLHTLEDEFWVEFNKNEFSKAQAIVDEMGKLGKDSKEYQEGSTRILVRTSKHAEAEVALQKCLELFPDSRSCLTDMVNVQMMIGTQDEQLQAVEQCLEALPDYPQCLNNLAMVRMSEGNYEEAVTIYERLLRENGSFGFRFYEGMLESQMGYALEGAGRFEEAAQYFDRACRSNFSGSCAKFEELSRQL